MKATETLLALANYNSWRRGDESKMPHPAELGAVIDDAVNLLRKYAAMEKEICRLRLSVRNGLQPNETQPNPKP